MNLIAKNKKAYHDFEIVEKFEAGIVLSGSEVKAIRAGRVQLKEGFIRIVKGELFLYNVHITHLNTTNISYAPDEKRERKLLMHRKQIEKMASKMATEGMTLVPLMLYFNERNRAKLQIGLAKGKKLHDKRETLKKKSMQREAEQAMSKYR